MKKETLKNVLSVTAVLLVFVLVLGLVTRLLQPKYMETLVEGSMLSQYYEEYGDHDVIFIGDCEVYANFTPMEMYRSQGLTAYVRGSSQQLIWQSYYVLKETLEYEIPKVVVFNVNSMRYGEPISEAFNRLTIDQMKWSADKVAMIQASMMEEEDFLSYVFPILRYHSRFDELASEDLQYLFRIQDNTWQGYQLHTEINPVGTLPTKRVLASYDFGDICWEYLDKMRLLCEENGAQLVLIKAPSLYPYWYDEYDAQIRDYAQEHGLKFYNLVDQIDTIGLDFSQDTYDGGLHLNLAGATKLSTYFSRILTEDFSLADHRNDPEISALYEAKLSLYDMETQKESE